ncbi:MBL fold metallo-hydrolase [Maribacter sp. 2210JD10-5]|uniref:MBL fold metallo-hydrolase n=1 Tax=Maribacter sp. 2210JD10-5 TaxID=3386272 RepID=UPI0039BCBD71
MRKLLKAFKKMLLFASGLFLALVIVVILFVNLSPEFGRTPSKEKKELFRKSPNFRDGVFINIGDVKSEMDFNKFMKMLGGYIKGNPNTEPDINIPVLKIDSTSVAQYTGPTRLVWFGHSAFLLQIEGKNILIDPMFGDVPAPHPLLGPKRFSKSLPIEISKLPVIDAVIFSHDHYDHLDYGSIQLLKDKVGKFYTPLGVGSHLEEWGISKNDILEMDWWDEITFEGLQLVCAPAQHFSGRGLTDKGKTLWSSWSIISSTEKIFFSGDSGYGAHFKEIGDRLGPFDFAMMECGQYNELWKEIHMMPEETAQAGLDVGAKQIMPIHWGGFKLAMHPWTEPVEKVSKKAGDLGLPIIVPKIGAYIYLNENETDMEKWWSGD